MRVLFGFKVTVEPLSPRWQFDRGLFVKMTPQIAMVTGRVGGRVAIVRAQHGIMTQAMADRFRERLGHVAPMFEIPATGHHVLLDEPLCLVTALRAVLAGWVPPSAFVTPDAPLLSGSAMFDSLNKVLDSNFICAAGKAGVPGGR